MNLISDISVWWLLPWAFIAFGASWFVYRNIAWLKESARHWKPVLISLRTLSIILIGILLIGILFEAIDYRSEKPLFINLVDNSLSMKNYSDSAEIQTSIKQYRSELEKKFGEEFEIVDYTVGRDVKLSGNLSFNEKQSALNEGFERIRENYYNRNIGGIAFFSDGNYNDGISPVYTAEKIALTPFFSVGVGDTIPKRDQLIKNVVSNEIAFYRNQFPVQVDLEALKIGNANALVSISRDGKTISSQNVNYSNSNYEFKQLTFMLDADKIGYQRYTVTVSRLDNEYNYQNNSRNFYVEILDSRNKILMLAGAPHPDIAALRSVMDQDENLEVKSVLLKNWDRDLKNTDLIVWHEPGIHYSPEINKAIISSGIPVLYIVGPNTPSNVASNLEIGLSGQTRNQTDEVQANFNSGFQDFEISDELKSILRNYPPLKTRFGPMNMSSGNKVFLYQQVGGIQKKEALVFFGNRGNTKYGVVYGEGLWKWKINEFAKTGDFKYFSELIQKIDQFLVLKQNTSALRIDMPKRFNTDQEVIIKAEFYNEAMELITSPEINFEFTGPSGKVFKNEFAVNGKSYRLTLGKLPAGAYTWKANTRFNGKTFEKSGAFVVEDIDLENLSTHANHGILKTIANNSGGNFYRLNELSRLLKDIEKRDDIASVSYKESSFNDLIDYKWLLFLLVILLGTEWFIRRWLGAY